MTTPFEAVEIYCAKHQAKTAARDIAAATIPARSATAIGPTAHLQMQSAFRRSRHISATFLP